MANPPGSPVDPISNIHVSQDQEPTGVIKLSNGDCYKITLKQAAHLKGKFQDIDYKNFDPKNLQKIFDAAQKFLNEHIEKTGQNDLGDYLVINFSHLQDEYREAGWATRYIPANGPIRMPIPWKYGDGYGEVVTVQGLTYFENNDPTKIKTIGPESPELQGEHVQAFGKVLHKQIIDAKVTPHSKHNPKKEEEDDNLKPGANPTPAADPAPGSLIATNPRALQNFNKVPETDDKGNPVTVAKVKADGNCFYYALMLGLNAAKKESREVLNEEVLIAKSPERREEVAQYVEENYEDDKDLQAYVGAGIQFTQEAWQKEICEGLIGLPAALLAEEDRPLALADTNQLYSLIKKLGKIKASHQTLNQVMSVYGNFLKDQSVSDNLKGIIDAALEPYTQLEEDIEELEDPQEYIQRIKEDKFFTSFPEIYAAAQIYGAEIVVYTKENGKVVTKPLFIAKPLENAPSPLPKIKILYNGRDHYDLIVS